MNAIIFKTAAKIAAIAAVGAGVALQAAHTHSLARRLRSREIEIGLWKESFDIATAKLPNTQYKEIMSECRKNLDRHDPSMK